MIPMRKLLPVPHSQQRREGSTALLSLLCGFFPALLLPLWPAALTLRSTIMVADWCSRRPLCPIIKLTQSLLTADPASGAVGLDWSRYGPRHNRAVTMVFAVVVVTSDP